MGNIHLDEKKEENTNNKYSNLLTFSDSQYSLEIMSRLKKQQEKNQWKRSVNLTQSILPYGALL